jgi:hypothetical protein
MPLTRWLLPALFLIAIVPAAHAADVVRNACAEGPGGGHLYVWTEAQCFDDENPHQDKSWCLMLDWSDPGYVKEGVGSCSGLV